MQTEKDREKMIERDLMHHVKKHMAATDFVSAILASAVAINAVLDCEIYGSSIFNR